MPNPWDVAEPESQTRHGGQLRASDMQQSRADAEQLSEAQRSHDADKRGTRSATHGPSGAPDQHTTKAKGTLDLTGTSGTLGRRGTREAPECPNNRNGTPGHASNKAGGTPAHSSRKASATPAHARKRASGTPAHGRASGTHASTNDRRGARTHANYNNKTHCAQEDTGNVPCSSRNNRTDHKYDTMGCAADICGQVTSNAAQLTVVKPSTIPWAGRGLFAACPIRRGTHFAQFSGTALTATQAANTSSRHKLQIHANLYVDAADGRFDAFHGKFVNDGVISGRNINARFIAKCCPVCGKWMVLLEAEEDIPAGAEILAYYGPKYGWERHADGERAVDICSKHAAIQTQPPRLPTKTPNPKRQRDYEAPSSRLRASGTLTSTVRHDNGTPKSKRRRECETSKSSRQTPDHKATGKQFLIIKPRPPKVDNTLLLHENDLTGQPMMPDRQDINVPTAKVIANAQKKLPKKQRQQSSTIGLHGQQIYVNKQGKILVPASSTKLKQALITLAHQDQHAHRSIDDSVKRLREFFTFPNLKDEATVFVHTCLHCMKIRGGLVTPRPTWEMMRATVPFEYVHSDWVDMPTAANGHKYMMIIIDDLSGTVLLHSGKTHTAEDTARVYVNEWLANYPDPTILHTDGGSHYVNSLLRAIADIRGYKHHITAPHAKWSHGVGERVNRKCLDALLQLLAQLRKDEKEWPAYIKLIQAQINRTATKSRGNLSPLQITTGLKAKSTFQHVLFEEHDAKLATAIPLNSQLIRQHIATFIDGLDETWGQAARARSKQSAHNAHARRQNLTVPQLDIGDYVLMAQPERISKLEFKWVGPLRVTNTISEFVYECEPISTRKTRKRIVHIARLRRFASKHLNVTEQIQRAADRDFPHYEVQKLLMHRVNKADGELHIKVKWLGFTKHECTWESAESLNKYVPGHVRAYTHDNSKDKSCKNFFNAHYL